MRTDQECEVPAAAGRDSSGADDKVTVTREGCSVRRGVGFVKLGRTPETFELLRDHHAFVLLTLIALRAQRVERFNLHGLAVGQALIGDHRSIGLSAREYRTAKQHLAGYGFATFQATNKGTIATLCSSAVYDTNNGTGDKPDDTRPTSRRQAGDNYQEGKKGRREEEDTCPEPSTARGGEHVITAEMCKAVYQAYPRHVGKQDALNAIRKVLRSGKRTCDQLLADVREYAAAQRGHPDETKIPYPATWMNKARWQDDRSQWSAWRRADRNGGKGQATPAPIATVPGSAGDIA